MGNSSRIDKLILTLIALCLFCFPLLAQKSKSQLEREKRQNQKLIEETENILSETETKTKASLGQLNAINAQIASTQKVIRNINDEVNLLNSEIELKGSIILSLESDLDNLKGEYAEMIYNTYKANRNQSTLVFLFSASSFNEFFRRLRYLKQYSSARRKQVTEIIKVREGLITERIAVEQRREEKETLLKDQIKERRRLAQLKKKQSSLVAQLKDREGELRAELDKRKKAAQELERLIAAVIKRELEAATNVNLTEITARFVKQKAKLEWPVNKGFISSNFGKSPHPALKGVITNNDGIDIQTKSDQKVHAVYDGVVTTVSTIPGYNNIVIVQHGDYRTVYARLKKVYVKKGQILAANQEIGEVFTDANGISEIKFQVWKKFEKLDPAKWLERR